MKVDSTVYKNSIIHIVAEYKNRIVTNIPQKYKKEEEKLREICESYRIINPAKKYKDQYHIYY